MICGVQELFVSDFQAFVIGVKGWQKKKKKKKKKKNQQQIFLWEFPRTPFFFFFSNVTSQDPILRFTSVGSWVCSEPCYPLRDSMQVEESALMDLDRGLKD